MSQIRRAQPEEAQLLTDIFWRSKAYWGYDAAFMQRIMGNMCIKQEQIVNEWVYVIEDAAGQVAGFYQLCRADHGLHLEDLFIEPEAIGKGYGRQLFDHAVELARELGYNRFTLESDPNAENFYLKMGCVRTGQHESLIPGRYIPHMEYHLK